MKKIGVGILVAVLFAGSVLAVKNVQDANVYGEGTGTDPEVREQPQEQPHEEESLIQTESSGQPGAALQDDEGAQGQTRSGRAERSADGDGAGAQPQTEEAPKGQDQAQGHGQDNVRMAGQTQEQAQAQATAEAQAQAQAAAEAQAQAQAEAERQAQAGSQDLVTEVSRSYIEDCGSDSGYWEIIYSDGHVEYVEDQS